MPHRARREVPSGPARTGAELQRPLPALNQLRLLVALDDCRGVREAARVTQIAQASVSRRLRALEDMLGVPLFERLASGMAPTAYGAALIRRSREALARLARAEKEIGSLGAALAGQVEVGAVMSPAMSLLPRAIARVKARAPALTIGVHVDSSDLLFDRLQRGRIDFMIGRVPEGRASDRFVLEPLGDEPVCVVVRPGHPLLCDARLTLSRLLPLPWILPARGSVLRAHFETMCRTAGLGLPRNVIDTAASLVVVALLSRTDALHVLPLEVARHYESLGVMCILSVALPCPTDAFGIVQDRTRPLSPAAAMLLDEVRTAAGALEGAKAPGRF
jgi:DNA-binding transcriptional LysR family regulator